MARYEGARKTGQAIVVCTSPDVCRTPMGDSTPPVPYQITANFSDSASVSPNVRFGGDPVFILDQSIITRVTGDEPGTAGGVRSGTNVNIVEPVEASKTVRVNKKRVVRHNDACKMNNGNTMGRVVYQPGGGEGEISARPETAEETRKAVEKKGLWSKMSGVVHGTLDAAGFIPGLGAVPDLVNAGIYALEGNKVEAGISAVAAIPGFGDAVKGGALVVKGGKAVARKVAKEAAEKAAKEATEKAAKEAAEKATKDKAKKEAAEQAAKKQGKENVHVKKNKNAEKGKCGEWLAKMDMIKEGFDEVVAVQNNSGHGVDLIGRNSKTGEVKVWEVKTTDGASARGLKGDQAKMGGEKYTNNRLKRAANGNGNYGKVPEAVKNGRKVEDWLKKAKEQNKPVTYEKRDVFIDDIEKGCAKHPNRPSRSKPWLSKGNI